MEARRCSLCDYVDVFPFVFAWENGCPVCGDADFVEEEEEVGKDED